MAEFDLKAWCDDVETIAGNIIDPQLTSKDRRKYERMLVDLTTPHYCLSVVRGVKELIGRLEKNEELFKNRLVPDREKC